MHTVFGVSWYLRRRKAFYDFLASLEFDGEYQRDFVFSAKSIIPLIKLYPEEMERASIKSG